MAGSGPPGVRKLSHLSPAEREAFLREVAFANFQRAAHLAWVFLGLCVLFLAVDWYNYRRSAWEEMPAYRVLTYLHLLLAATLLLWTVLATLFGPRSKEETRPLHRHLLFGFLVYVLLWATAVTLVDQLLHGEIIAFVMGCLAVSILGVYTPGQSLLLYVPCLLLFLAGVLWLQGNPDLVAAHIVNGTTAAAVGWVLSRVFFRVRLREFKDRQTIRSQQSELQRMAVEDFLTGLYNRRYLHSYLAQEYARSRRHGHPLTVAIGDLDGFKAVNDFVSHDAGDRVLSQIARILKETVRVSDVVGRYGGDEFVVVFPETPSESARVVCERVRATLEERVWDELGPDFHLTASFGLCDDLASGNHEKMLAAADEKLHEAKQAGRNLVLA
jgi:diguanylate cyclase (GGDEF)-like protein